MEPSNIQTTYQEALALYNTPYPETTTPAEIFNNFYGKFVKHHLQIAADGKINELIVTILIPRTVPDVVITETQNLFLSQIQSVNPGLTWSWSLHDWDESCQIYTLMLYQIFAST
jgi:hypothetical protein